MTTYREVCAAWPDPMPIPTEREAIAGVKRLVRVAHRHAVEEGVHFGLSKYHYRITTGRRWTQMRNRTWHINCNGRYLGGWGDIVHCVSHWAHGKYWPREKSHGPRHVFIERMLTDYAIKHFLDGKLVRPLKPKPAVSAKAKRAASVTARIKKWEAKKRRAESALRKLRKQERYYGRPVRDTGVPPASTAGDADDDRDAPALTA